MFTLVANLELVISIHHVHISYNSIFSYFYMSYSHQLQF